MKFYIRGRRLWGAEAPRDVTPQAPGSVRTIVVHHTAGRRPFTAASAKREMRGIQRQHMIVNGWSDIGYNYVIDGFGRVWEGRGSYRVGAHTLGQNTGTIGVSFMGNYERQKLTGRQVKAFRALLKRLEAHGIHPSRVRGHKQMPHQATSCPGRNIMRQLNLG